MALFKIRTTRGVQTCVKFWNCNLYKYFWQPVGLPDNHYDKSGHYYKFTEFNTECNVFKYGSNELKRVMHVRINSKNRTHVFQKNKYLTAKF